MLKYARIHTFYRLMAPYARRTRARRSRQLIKLLNIQSGMRIIDLGGTPEIWQGVAIPLNITVLNLPGSNSAHGASRTIGPHQFTFVEGDACATGLPSGSFDVAFSNSVIEHVGDSNHQQAFAAEVRRLAPRFWVQTPAKSFPIEAHTGMPFWWY